MNQPVPPQAETRGADVAAANSKQGVVPPPPAAVTAAPLWQNVVSARYQPAKTAWLISFIDLTGLMVVFFVLMFSMQTMEAQKWEAIAGSFRTKFAPRETVVESVASDVNNAEIRTHVARSGLGYLNVLLQQHLEGSEGWAGLRGQERRGVRGSEMVYEIATDKHDPQVAKAQWEALGAALRGWKNPVGVRVTAPQEALGKAAQKAQRFAMILNATGVDSAFAEVVEGEAAVQLIVRAR